MKIATIKGMVAKVLTAGFLAGAVAMAVPAKADAQQVFIGAYPRHERFDRYERFRAEEFRKHEAWVRAREFRHFERNRGFYR
jgi:hypothetical protein